jgi:hypothetical protein
MGMTGTIRLAKIFHLDLWDTKGVNTLSLDIVYALYYKNYES